MEKQLDQGAMVLLNYGAIGVFCFLLIIALIVVGKVMAKWRMEDRQRMKKLEDKLEEYLKIDQKAILQCLNATEEVIRQNTKVLERLLEKKGTAAAS
jgi:uncharacterized membrane protein